MSDRDQEIIASLRRAYDAFSRGDFDTAIEIARRYDPGNLFRLNHNIPPVNG